MPARLPASLAVVAALLLAAPDAFAQPTVGNPFTLTITDTALSSYSFSRGDCTNTDQVDIPFTWATTSTPFVGPNETEAVYLATSTSCTRPTDATQLLVDRGRTPGQLTGTYPSSAAETDLLVKRLFDFIDADPACGGDDGFENDVYLCVAIKGTPLGGTETTRTASVKFRVDSKPPPVPTLAAVNARESALEVVWTMPATDTDATGFRVYVTPAGGQTRPAVAVGGGSTRSTVISGLENGTVYAVQVTSVDGAGSEGRTATFGNESARSDTINGTPLDVQDFFERYADAGGDETGGCGAASPVLLLLPLALLRRRRAKAGAKSLMGTGLFVAALLVSAPASAEGGGVLPSRLERQSPQHFTFEVRTGPYTPSIDQEAGLTGTPYKDIFGTSAPLFTRLELDFDFLHTIVGRFGVGASVGLWEAAGKGRYPAQGDAQALDVVTLSLVPITALLSWRVDVFYDRFGVPLVPYLKVGYGLTSWSSRVNGVVSTSKRPDGTVLTAEGWARGLEFGGGIQLALDGLEPGQAVSLDRDWGINSTLLFVEAQLNTFTGAGGLRLDGFSIAGGLALAF